MNDTPEHTKATSDTYDTPHPQPKPGELCRRCGEPENGTQATFCVSKQQVEALAKALLHRGDNLGGYERKKPDDIRHGDIWCVERILKDAGIPYEQA